MAKLRNVAKDLVLSRESFKEEVKGGKTRPYDWLTMPVFPEEKVLAEISSLVYKDPCEAPEGWEVLTTARNERDGYFGAAFWNPVFRQVVIAHRGTSDLKAIQADVEGIICNLYTSQMSSACSFAALVVDELRGSEQHVSFTGHSLGAWLAQITTLTTKYLIRSGDGFTKITNSAGSEYHAHTVVFDSPGCKRMLVKLSEEYYLRHDDGNEPETKINALDITVFLSAPNVVNTCNRHVGKLFRIYSKLPEDKNRWFFADLRAGLEYNKVTHNMDGLVKAMKDIGLGHVKYIIDWPLVIWPEKVDSNYSSRMFDVIPDILSSSYIDEEYQGFHANYSRDDSDYTVGPKEEIDINGKRIRYLLREVDVTATRNNVFTYKELKFLKHLTCLNKYLKLDIIQAFLEELDLDEHESILKVDFEIEGNKIKCDTKETLQAVISRTRQLFLRIPEISGKMKEQIEKTPSVHGALYSMNSKKYCSHVLREGKDASKISFNDYVGLKNLLKSGKCVLHVTALEKGEASLTPMRLCYNMLSHQHENCTYLSCSDLHDLECEGVDTVKVFKETFIDDRLLVIDCSKWNELKKIRFQEMLSHCNDKRGHSTKIILVTNEKQKSKIIRELLNEYEEIVKEIEMKPPVWKDLTEDSKKYLLAKKLFRFQEQDTLTSLEELVIGPNNWTTAMLDDIIDSETIDRLIEGGEIKIGCKALCMSALSAAYYRPQEQILIENLLNGLRNTLAEDTIFMIKSADLEFTTMKSVDKELITELKTHKRIEMDAGIDKASSLNQFMQLCKENPNKIIHWVEILDTDAHKYAQWLMLYDGRFYFQRKITKIVLCKEIRNELIGKNYTNSFIFSGVDRKEDLIKILTIDGNDLEKFLSNVQIQVGSSTEIVNTAGNTHWLEVEESNNEQHIVWRRSTGSLDVLRKYIDEDKSKVVSKNETNFSQLEDKILIIADKPGMGKTTTLTSMSDQLVKNAWVVRVDLGNCQEAIRKLPSSPSSYTWEEAVDFLSPVDKTSWNSKFTNRLLQCVLENSTPKPVVLLFDGFDEIKDLNTDKENVLALLKFLQAKSNHKTKMCITTRDYQKKILETSLSVFASSFESVNSKQQEDFLKKFWQVRRCLKSSILTQTEEGQRMEEFAQELLSEARNILGLGIDSFVGVPLQMRMLAEGFQQELESYIVSQDLKIIKLKSILDIYQRFIRAKFGIYLQEKSGVAIDSDQNLKVLIIDTFEAKHRILAFFLLCPEEHAKFARIQYFETSGKFEKEKELFLRIGLIQLHAVQNQFQFIHLSFAEYFTADFLMECLKELKVNASSLKNTHLIDFILKGPLITPKFKVVRTFLNELLLKNDTLSLCTYKVTYYRNKAGRTALHILARENHAHIAKFLLLNFVSETGEDVNILDHGGNTALYIAARSGNFDFIVFLLRNGARIIVKDSYANTPLHQAVRNEHLHLSAKTKLETLTWKELEEYFNHFDVPKTAVAIGKKLFNSWELFKSNYQLKINDDDHQLTIDKMLLFVETTFQSRYHTALFADIKASVNACSEGTPSPLHCAAMMGHDVFVKALVWLGADVNAVDCIGMTPLHYVLALAAASDHAPPNTSVTLPLFSPAIDEMDFLPFKAVTFDSYSNIVKVLVDHEADINARLKDGTIPLQRAVHNKDISVPLFELLLKHNAGIDARGKDDKTILHDQAEQGNVNDVRMLIRKGANPNVVDKSGRTPLMLAEENGDIPKEDLERIKQLLSGNCDIELENSGE